MKRPEPDRPPLDLRGMPLRLIELRLKRLYADRHRLNSEIMRLEIQIAERKK
jgi:hypothetical protein